MSRFKGVIIIMMLIMVTAAWAASTKSASVLLQEGLFAEEIEGDLDAAIEIYGQRGCRHQHRI